jgi:hypothetical protein
MRFAAIVTARAEQTMLTASGMAAAADPVMIDAADGLVPTARQFRDERCAAPTDVAIVNELPSRSRWRVVADSCSLPTAGLQAGRPPLSQGYARWRAADVAATVAGHNRQPDHLRRAVEIAKWVGHSDRLPARGYGPGSFALTEPAGGLPSRRARIQRRGRGHRAVRQERGGSDWRENLSRKRHSAHARRRRSRARRSQVGLIRIQLARRAGSKNRPRMRLAP